MSGNRLTKTEVQVGQKELSVQAICFFLNQTFCRELSNCKFPENHNEMKKKENKRRKRKEKKRKEKRRKGGNKQQENPEGS